MLLNGVRFEVLSAADIVVGEPHYVREDYAFDFCMTSVERERVRGSDGSTSFLIGTLQLEVAIQDLRCLYIWGYCPMGGWMHSCLTLPNACRGYLQARSDRPLISGVSIGIEEQVSVAPWFDPASGWFCIGQQERASDEESVEFATNCIAVMVRGQLTSLWVKPANWQEVADEFVNAKGIQVVNGTFSGDGSKP